MNIGIVGHEAAKFTKAQWPEIRRIIEELLAPRDAVCVSGACHLGGIDVWAEKVAKEMGRKTLIFPPADRQWSTGYKPRNIQIAKNSDIVHVIVAKTYPEGYAGMRFNLCYHCNTTDHIKSGGCWTAHYARRKGKWAQWHVIE